MRGGGEEGGGDGVKGDGQGGGDLGASACARAPDEGRAFGDGGSSAAGSGS